MTADMIVCPHCGKENFPQVTRCVHCGKELEELFRIEGVEGTPPLPSDASGDLPEILKSFREEEREVPEPAESKPTSEGQEEVPQSQDAETPPPETEELQVPEWLARIRARAAQEADATGDLASRAGTMDQVRSGEKHAEIDKEFTNWIARLRESKQREVLQSARKTSEEGENAEGPPEWLQKIRELHPEIEGEETQPVESEPLEAGAAMLEAAEPEETLGQETQPVEEATAPAQEVEAAPPEEALPKEPQQELTEEQPEEQVEPQTEAEVEETTPEQEAAEILEPIVEDLGMQPETSLPSEEAERIEEESAAQDLLLLRSQKERAEILRNLIAEEGKAFPPTHRPKTPSKGWYRLVIGLLLLTAIIGTLLFVPPPPLREGAAPVHTVALQEALQALTAGDKVLVVLDYQPATRYELEPVAAPLLQFLAERGVDWQLLTTQPSGLWLAQELASAAGITTTPSVAYLPGGNLGVLALAVDQNQTMVFLPTGVSALSSYRAVLLLEDSGSQFQVWMEQAAPWLGKGKFLVLITNQDAAIVLPYYDSGQVTGYAAGTQEGAYLAKSLGQQPTQAPHERALQVGLIVMIVLLILGMITRAETDATNRRREKQA
ncbi:MAG TPA: hypothetical protein DCG78_06005 [Anaerolineaceae bacterium]|nr:hypothetical protein [Anaerolineaceae bacterium]